MVSGITKSKGLKNTSVHSDGLMVSYDSQQSDTTLEEEGDANEKCLMANHLYEVPSEWLTEVSASSQPDKSTKSDKIVLNPRKRS